MAHEPQSKQQSKEAGASGWIGSALEYYDFFITRPRRRCSSLSSSSRKTTQAPETYRTHLDDLGDPKAVPVPKSDYDRVRADRIAAAAQDA